MKAFISYDRNDALLAREIHSLLKSLGVDAFIDDTGIRPGDQWPLVIQKEISSTDVFVVLWSKSAEESSWVMREILAAIDNKKKIIPCTLDETPICGILRSIHALDFSDRRSALKKLQELVVGQEDRTNADNFTTKNRREAINFYKSQVREKNQNLRVLGAKSDLTIQDAYLPLVVCSAVGDSTECISGDMLTHAGVGKTVILGLPGTGKTTLLQYIAFECANETNVCIPILVKIRELSKTNQSLTEYLQTTVKGLTSRSISETISGSDEFCNANTILLLDGLDEISEADYIEFIKRLETFIVGYPHCNLIITSRFTGFRSSDFDQFAVYKIQPLEDPDIKNYIEKVCPPEARNRVWQTISGDERLLDLSRTPFLLAMICNSPHDIGVRATQRATLYDTCIRYLLRRADWQVDRPKQDAEMANVIEKALMAIAVKFFKLDSSTGFPKDELVLCIGQVLSSTLRLKPSKILDQICSITGLLQQFGDEYSFVHRSIWEYFVAKGMRGEELNNLLSRSNVTSWEEPIRLYVGLTPERDLESVLDKLWQRNKGLAMRCMHELSRFPEEILFKLKNGLDTEEEIRLVRDLREFSMQIQTELERRRLLIDTLTSLSKFEKNCQVIYEIVTLLEESDFPAAKELVSNILQLKESATRRSHYLTSTDFSFKLVEVEGGSFMMGSDTAPDPRERPSHKISLTPFKISATLVTNAMYYDSFPYAEDRRNDYSRQPKEPVNMVNWYEAAVFARWLGCDLPSEAQWEYACRSGGKDDKVLGDLDQIGEYAWFGLNSGNKTHEVATKKPNTFGLYDMQGNLREWCKDWHEDNYYEQCANQSEVRNPQGPVRGTNKVLRGGCFDWAVTNLRPTYRNHNLPSNIYFCNGFRVVFNEKDSPLT